MTLIKSISGIRGTIGGKPGEALTPLDVVSFISAYGTWLSEKQHSTNKIILGRDARTTGASIAELAAQTLIHLGYHVIDLGLSTTPTVEIAVIAERACGGIVISASHNPEIWNALKLLNSSGEFLSAADGERILSLANQNSFEFSPHNKLGHVEKNNTYLQFHIDTICKLPLVNLTAIAKANFSVVVDGVNSSGGIAVPALLERLGVKNITKICCEPTGIFQHNPEPLPENLHEISQVVKERKANVGIVVDPDVDRLALICDNGEMFGEEYTLVAVADYILKKSKILPTHRNMVTISNLSSSRALRDISTLHGALHYQSAVGEVNVVTMMKEQNAIIGGEGNGGIIYPEIHYGRDALVGIALFLSLLAESKMTSSELRASYPSYYISKNKIQVSPQTDLSHLLSSMAEKHKAHKVSTIDGVKIDLPDSWIHLRRSNTEPIVRIYTEAKSQREADELACSAVHEMKEILGMA